MRISESRLFLCTSVITVQGNAMRVHIGKLCVLLCGRVVFGYKSAYYTMRPLLMLCS